MKKAREKEKEKIRHPRYGSQQQQAGPSKPPPQLSKSPESSRRSSMDSAFSGYSFDSESDGLFSSEIEDNKLFTEQQQAEEFSRLLETGRIRPESTSKEQLEGVPPLLIERQLANLEPQLQELKKLQQQKQQLNNEIKELTEILQTITMNAQAMPPEYLQQIQQQSHPLISVIMQQAQQIKQQIEQQMQQVQQIEQQMQQVQQQNSY